MGITPFMTENQKKLVDELVSLNLKIQQTDDKQEIIACLKTAVDLALPVEPCQYPSEELAYVRKMNNLQVIENEVLYIDVYEYTKPAILRYYAGIALLTLTNTFTAVPFVDLNEILSNAQAQSI